MHSDPIETLISDEAIEWFSRLHSGRPTPEDISRFEAWRKLSSSHAEAYADIEKLWILLDRSAQRVFEQEQTQTRTKTRPAPSARKSITPFAKEMSRRTLIGISLAAVMTMLAWLPGAFLFWSSDYHTHWGERLELTLEDGSQVTLNTHTALSVEFSPQQRVIKLQEGEAYFQVTHNPIRPFIVVTDHGAIKVTGTAFDIHEQDDRMTVTVSEGRVKVYRDGDEQKAVELTAGWQATSNIYGTSPLLHVDAKQVSAWRNGFLEFNLQSLASVVDELNRYFPGKIMIADPRIRKRTVSGAFDLTHPQDILSALEKNLGLRALNLSVAMTLLYQPGF